jgi:hypothetical protein
MEEECKNREPSHGVDSRRVFGVVCRGEPEDFQRWLDSARAYDMFVVLSKSTRTSKLVIVEESW